MPIAVKNDPAPPRQGEWDAFVTSHDSAHFLQTGGWGRLKGQFNWEPHLALLRGPSHQIIAGVQLLHTRRHGISMGYAPRGPLLNWDDMDLAGELRDRMLALARQLGMHFIKIEPDLEDLPVNRLALRQLGFQPSVQTIQPRSTIKVDLSVSEDELLARMKSKWRYNIRKAARSQVSVRCGTLDDLDVFQALLEETSTRQGFSHHSLAYHRAAFEAMPDTLRLLLAEVQGETVAALTLATCGRGAWYPWGASSNRHRQAMPNYALQFAAMRWAKRSGAEYYDLWGIPAPLGALARNMRLLGENREWPEALPVDLARLPARDLWSVYRLKQGFGGRIVNTVGAWDLPVQPAVYRLYVRGHAALRTVQSVRGRVTGQGQSTSEAARATAAPAPARHLLAKAKSPGHWNRVLTAQADASFMQSWEWGELKQRFGWQPHRLRLTSGKGTDLGVMQVLIKRPHALGPAFAYVPRGPVLDWTDAALVDFALDTLERRLLKEGCAFVRIEPNLRRDLAHGMATISRLEARGWRFNEYPTQIQNSGQSMLDADDAALMASFKSRCRNKIRHARRNGLTVRHGTLADLPQFYDLYVETGSRKGFGVRSFDYYRSVMAACNLGRASAEGHGMRSTLLLAEERETGVVGAACVLALGDWAWYLFGASSGRHCGSHPNHLVQWEAMQWALAQGCTRYDWWGAPLDPDDKRDPMHGVWRFKLELGAQFSPLIGSWDRCLIPGLEHIGTRALHMYHARRKRDGAIRGVLPV